MQSLKRLTANRANAQRSTGPKSVGGKKRSSMNSLKHGLTAKTLVLRGEEPAEFDRLYAHLVEEFDPRQYWGTSSSRVSPDFCGVFVGR
jgi:hypothetical protein